MVVSSVYSHSAGGWAGCFGGGLDVGAVGEGTATFLDSATVTGDVKARDVLVVWLWWGDSKAVGVVCVV